MNEESGLNSRALALIAFLLHLNACLTDSEKPGSKPLGGVEIRRKNLTSEILIYPPQGHHFNLKAPQEIKQSDRAIPLNLSPEQISVKADHITADLLAQGTLMVCDEKETYCVAKKIAFTPADIKAESQ